MKAFLIIDMQTALVTGAWQEQAVLQHIEQVASKCRAIGTPVIYIQHNHATFEPMMKGRPGWQIHAAIFPHDGDILIEKEACDAFYGNTLKSTLQNMGVDTLLIAGMQTEYCVDATVRAALSHDFNVVVLADCHTTGDAELSAADIIRHHNLTFSNLVHPSSTIRVVDCHGMNLDTL
ncbi:MAG: cysteine hydrolase family protein [Pseudomonadota bacterium]